VASDDELALEAQQQVLADRLHSLEHAAVDPFRDPRRLRAWVRRLHFEPLTHEHLQLLSGASKRIALGHDPSLD